ncbi:MAG: hypothetical protein ACOC44_11580 [Promethearchaeia archaeon]
MSLLNSLNTLLYFVSGTALVIGNYTDNLLAKVLGLIIGGISFALGVYNTQIGGETTVDEKILSNTFNSTLFLGMIFTLGFFFVGNEIGLRIFFQIGLISGLFLVFMIIWTYLKGYWSFLEEKHIRFEEESDKEDIPQFLLSSVILGSIFAGLFTIFEMIYIAAGYLITSIVFLSIFFGLTIFMSLLIRFVLKYQNTLQKKKKTTQKTEQKTPEKKEEAK